MKFLTREQVIGKMYDLGHKVFTHDVKDYNLNIVGIRSPEAKLDKFGCQKMVFWKHKGQWYDFSYRITTYPGRKYMIDKLLNPLGCAILVPGQYLNTYMIALHRGQYDALCQKLGPVKVYRDKDRDEQFDLDKNTIMTGYFGINIHNSRDKQTTLRVGAHSAGCQVFANDREYEDFMELCVLSRNAHGNKFSYTLIDGF